MAVSGHRTSIHIQAMDCPTEEVLIRKKLGQMREVQSLEFNLMQRILTVHHSPNSLDAIFQALQSIGFKGEIVKSGEIIKSSAHAAKSTWLLIVSISAACASEALNWLGQVPEGIIATLSILAVLTSGLQTYKKGWLAIKNGNLNINALMSVAVTGAMALGQWPEAAMVMVLFTIAELIESRSLDRARNAIEGLMKLAPETATVKLDTGKWIELNVNEIAVGSVVKVRPGERIALDGVIVEGRTTVDQSPITGESLPIDKASGDLVYAGTINQSGSLEFRVSKPATQSTLARIIDTVENAQAAKAPTQRFVDQFARVYTPLVFALALTIAVVPPLAFDQPFYDWIYRALVLLVIACPCALVISTPVTVVSGLTTAARQGILIKGGGYLELGRKLSVLALDKTGTITQGKPVQTDFELLSDCPVQHCEAIALGLASQSDHPVSIAIANALSVQSFQAAQPDNFKAIPGKGTSGLIDGIEYHLGNPQLARDKGLTNPKLDARIDALEKDGKTVVLLFNRTTALALIAVADTVKESSREAIRVLHQMGLRTIMLTGDNSHTASAIAQQVGIDVALGNQLPDDKLKAIETYSQSGITGMVGDGINDAPALARAHIGFAMGAMGTDTSIETADVALMDDDLNKIATFIRLSKATGKVLIQNIAFALGIKSVFLVMTLSGMGTMWMAVFADVGASLLVVANGLRLLQEGANKD